MTPFIPRALSAWVDLAARRTSDPMVLLSGPRQVGTNAYFNWDTPQVKRAHLDRPLFFRDGDPRWVIFDEIHKRRDWKRLLKGFYDSPDRRENFIVTGSGRLEQFQRGGDSLQGRYDLFQLWPLTVDELARATKPMAARPRDFRAWEPDAPEVEDAPLLELGGFPAPFHAGSARGLRRWQDQYLDRVVREDVRDFSAVHRLDQIDLLARLLPGRVSSPISALSLAQDVEASPVGIKGWLRLFETLFFGFRLPPFHRHVHRAIKREPKWYFYQWTYVEDPEPRFENYLAVQLGAALRSWSEQGYGRWELFYLRDQDRREVDFLVTRDLKPQALIEAKVAAQPWPNGLRHYVEKLGVPGFLLYPSGPVRREGRLGFSVPSGKFLRGLLLRP
jgi:uncharacterized protein